MSATGSNATVVLGVDDSTLSRAVGPVGLRRGRERALTDKQIAYGRALRAAGWTWQAIADEFGCGVTTARRTVPKRR